MKPIKKSSSLLALVLLTTTFNHYSMKNTQDVRSIPTDIIANILLGFEELNPNKLSLPPEDQYQIINLLFTHTHTNSLQVAAKTISSLAQVNTQLHALINNPQLCLQLIKYLALKFKCSDQQVATTLQIPEAQRRLKLQNILHKLCTADSLKGLPSLDSLCQQEVDLEFTYTSFFPDFFPTPLMLAATMNTGILEKLCSISSDLLDVNQRSLEGETALVLAIQSGLPFNVKTLLDANADPLIADNDGLTPLKLAQLKHNQEIIDLIQEAINKKQSKNK